LFDDLDLFARLVDVGCNSVQTNAATPRGSGSLLASESSIFERRATMAEDACKSMQSLVAGSVHESASSLAGFISLLPSSRRSIVSNVTLPLS
jgi:hypothetical protein